MIVRFCFRALKNWRRVGIAKRTPLAHRSLAPRERLTAPTANEAVLRKDPACPRITGSRRGSLARVGALADTSKHNGRGKMIFWATLAYGVFMSSSFIGQNSDPRLHNPEKHVVPRPYPAPRNELGLGKQWSQPHQTKRRRGASNDAEVAGARSGNCRVFIATIEYVRPSDQRKICS